MSYSKPEAISRHEWSRGYRKWLKRKRTKAERRLRRLRVTGGRVKVPMFGWST